MSKDGSKHKLEEVTHEKDLGITFESNGSFDKHIDNIVLKANRNLGIIRRTFQQIDQEMLVVLYKSLVRPILEYGSQVWSPLKKGQIDRIESVQRRMTRILPKLRKKPYSERLIMLGLPTLNYRRLRADLIQIYKLMNQAEYMPEGFSLELSKEGRTRGHYLKLKKQSCNTKLRQNTLAIRVVNWWNKLPKKVVLAENVNIFKDGLNRFFEDSSLKFGE